VSRIIVRTLGGNDQVDIRDVVTTPGDLGVFDSRAGFEVDLGGGDDAFSFQLSNQLPQPLLAPAMLAVTGGDGKDTLNVSADILWPPPAVPSLITLNGGKGDDTIRVSVRNLQGTGLSRFPNGLFVAVNGQEGADRLSAEVIVPNPEGITRNAVLTLSGGGGPDRVSASTQGPLTVRVWGQGGNDRLRLTARRLLKHGGPLTNAGLRGGPGTDVCRVAGRVNVDGCER
jgi:hypothetical protein